METAWLVSFQDTEVWEFLGDKVAFSIMATGLDLELLDFLFSSLGLAITMNSPRFVQI